MTTWTKFCPFLTTNYLQWTFLTLNVDKNRYFFLDHLPPLLVHVVIECPIADLLKESHCQCHIVGKNDVILAMDYGHPMRAFLKLSQTYLAHQLESFTMPKTNRHLIRPKIYQKISVIKSNTFGDIKKNSSFLPF